MAEDKDEMKEFVDLIIDQTSENLSEIELREIFSTFGEVSNMARTFVSFTHLYTINKTQKALKASGAVLSGKNEFDQISKEKIKKQIEKRKPLLEVTLRFMETVQQTYSLKTAQILGIYLGKIVESEDLENNQESAVIIQALSSINDFDIEHFYKIYSFLDANGQSTPLKIYLNGEEFKTHYSDNEKKEISNLKASINKLYTLQLLNLSGGLNGSDLYSLNNFSTAFLSLLDNYHKLYD